MRTKYLFAALLALVVAVAFSPPDLSAQCYPCVEETRNGTTRHYFIEVEEAIEVYRGPHFIDEVGTCEAVHGFPYCCWSGPDVAYEDSVCGQMTDDQKIAYYAVKAGQMITPSQVFDLVLLSAKFPEHFDFAFDPDLAENDPTLTVLASSCSPGKTYAVRYRRTLGQ